MVRYPTMSPREAIGFLPLLALNLALGCAPEPVSPLSLLGVWHRVEAEDSLQKVAERYGADPATVAELNDLPGDGSLAGRAEIFIPKRGGKPPGTGAPPTPRPAPPAKTSAAASRCGQSGRPCLAWPAAGPVVATYGPRGSGHHDGIDIRADRGSPVRAALDGVVLYSGDEIKGYGNLIIIRHDDDILTVYAHNEKNLTNEGQEVRGGQQVARVGHSGSSTEVGLHFEVRLRESPVDPLHYLVPKEEQ